MNYFVDSQKGSDTNPGTESQPWKTIAAAQGRAKSGDVVTLEAGAWPESLTPASGTTWRARNAGAAILTGLVPAGGAWKQGSDGVWALPLAAQAFGVWLGKAEQMVKQWSANNRDYNSNGENPALDIDPALAESQFKWKNGILRVRTPSGASPLEYGIAVAGKLTAIECSEADGVTIDGIAVSGWKTAISTKNGSGLVFRNLAMRMLGSVAVWLTNVNGAELRGCVVQGAGSWLGHYDDCVFITAGKNLIDGCDLSLGGHGLLIALKGGQGLAVANSFLHDSGGSGITVKQGWNDGVFSNLWIERMATAKTASVRGGDYAGFQLSGRHHVVRNSVIKTGGKHMLLSSDGTQVCQDCLFDHLTMLDADGNGIEIQQGGALGSIARNLWQNVILLRAGADLISIWLPGADRDMAGNRFSGQIAGAQIRGTNGTFATVEEAKAQMPAVYAGASSHPVAGAGSSLTSPPDTPNPPVTPPPGNGGGGGTGAPVLAALTPSHGLAGTVIHASGTGFGTQPAVIIQTTAGPSRLTGLGGNDTSVSWTVPPDAVTGAVFVRNMDTNRSSNSLMFTVTGGGPPIPPDPPPVKPLAVMVGASATSSGASFLGTVADTAPLPDGSVIAVTVTTPDGRTGAGRTVLGGVTPPVPTPVPPPAGGLQITGLDRTNAAPGQAVKITGSGFDAAPLAEWGGLDMKLTGVTPKQITAVAGQERGTEAVVVRQGNDEAAAPAPLTVG